MGFNFRELGLTIESATRKAFIEMVKLHKGERIYAFALYSDEGAMTVCPSTNTLDFLDTRPQNNPSYYKYEPAEWKYEGDGADVDFSVICGQLFDEVEDDMYDEEEDEDGVLFEVFQSQLYKTCVEVLIKLKKENFFSDYLVGPEFDRMRDEIKRAYFVKVADSFDSFWNGLRVVKY